MRLSSASNPVFPVRICLILFGFDWFHKKLADKKDKKYNSGIYGQQNINSLFRGLKQKS
jgi:hypothetical protein